MALRVLLADESSTIRKVFQLALQDYAVDVKAVHNGLDVTSVGRPFKPDIIFIDVLLAKKSGYEVAAELKQDNELKSIPVILMWSSFMELDKDKYQASQAEAHLEKPFDVQKLRGLIQQYVPKTKDQTLSKYLTFPDIPAFDEEPPQAPTPPSKSDWNMESFDQPEVIEELEEFQTLPLKTEKIHNLQPSVSQEDLSDQQLLSDNEDESEADSSWQPKTLTKFKVELPTDLEDEDLPVSFDPEASSEKEEALELEIELDDSKELLEPLSEPLPKDQHKIAGEAAPLASLSQERLEEIVREECQKMLESVIWKVVPELAKSLIEKELNNLLSDQNSDSGSYTQP